MAPIQAKPVFGSPKRCLKFQMCSWKTQGHMNARQKTPVEGTSSEDSCKYIVSFEVYILQVAQYSNSSTIGSLQPLRRSVLSVMSYGPIPEVGGHTSELFPSFSLNDVLQP